MVESFTAYPEQLSNNRLVYETCVTALRRVTVGHLDAHYVRGSTPEAGDFVMNDYLYFELSAGAVTNLLTEGYEAREAILDTRRPLITIDYGDKSDGSRHSYAMLYPEDLRPNGYLKETLFQEIIPSDWPANEPLIYRMRSGQGQDGWQVEHRLITEPFSEPALAAIYDEVVRFISERTKYEQGKQTGVWGRIAAWMLKRLCNRREES